MDPATARESSISFWITSSRNRCLWTSSTRQGSRCCSTSFVPSRYLRARLKLWKGSENWYYDCEQTLKLQNPRLHKEFLLW